MYGDVRKCTKVYRSVLKRREVSKSAEIYRNVRDYREFCGSRYSSNILELPTNYVVSIMCKREIIFSALSVVNF